mgnify:CR=1 FL=1|tara:strand:- start:42544 stop:43677 length:1134 start_codon:yes stop_codon:yes gene_type:complete
MNIPFNKPYLTGKETGYIKAAVNNQKISGNGIFTKKCQHFFEHRYGIKKALLTTSCTDALEMAAILININEGDEVIMPSFTYVSTANAFVLRGAKIVFCDSRADYPGMDEMKIESLITSKTKAIVPVHYAGIACHMDKIMKLAKTHNLFVVEDAAQAIDSYYTFPDGTKKALGSIGHLATFSFHETKNIISGEGGLLAINDEQFIERAEIIWEKGTNRCAFFRGEINEYSWVDVGSSFLPSEITAAFLWAQLGELDSIQNKRKKIWNTYEAKLKGKSKKFRTAIIPSFAHDNSHMFYLLFENHITRQEAILRLRKKGILAIFHYIPLHSSPFFKNKYEGQPLLHCDLFSKNILRLPFFNSLKKQDQQKVINALLEKN